MANPFQIISPIVLICEGRHDRAFLERLLHHRGLRHICAASCEELCGSGGNGAFTKAINSLIANPRFGMVTGVVVVADSDVSHPASFADIQTRIQNSTILDPRTHSKLSVPTTEGLWENGSPKTAIQMIPVGAPSGCLDDMLFDALSAADPPLGLAINAFTAAANVHTWGNANAIAKFKVRCAVSARSHGRPLLPVQNLWDVCPASFPIASPIFRPLGDALEGLAASI